MNSNRTNENSTVQGARVYQPVDPVQTRSKYSHAAILLDDENIVEAWQGAGVRLKRIKDFTNVDTFDVLMTETEKADVRGFLADQIGKRYDYLGVIRFVTRRHANDRKAWFCSELVFAAFQSAGINLLDRIPASEVSPAMLALSPKLWDKTQLSLLKQHGS